MTSRRIAIACTDIPEFGGAGAVAHAIHAGFLAEGFESTCVNLIDPPTNAYCQYILGGVFGNPHALPGVKIVRPNESADGADPEVKDCVSEISPDLLIGVGSDALLTLKQALPDVRSLLISDACNHCELDTRFGATRAGQAARRSEAAAVASADFVVAHSEIARDSFRRSFPGAAGKVADDICWFDSWIANDVERYAAASRSFEQRSFDLLFVARDWSKPHSNRSRMAEIAEGCRDLDIAVVGEGGDVGGVRFHPEIPQRGDLLTLMGDARVAVVPARNSSACFVEYEAAAMGCSIVTSRECGTGRFPDGVALPDSANLGDWLEGIRAALARPSARISETPDVTGPNPALFEIAAVL